MHVSRRIFSIAAALTLCSSVWAQTPTPTAAPAVTLIYFGTSSCSTCRAWKTFDLPKLKETDAFKAARFVEIEKAITQPIPDADKFPADLAPLRDAISHKFGGKISSPMFVVVKGSTVTWHWRGAPDNAKVVEALQAALKTE